MQDSGARGAGDDEALVAYSRELLDAVEAAVPGWVRRCVNTRAEQAGLQPDDALAGVTEEAARVATEEVTVRLRELLSTDIDQQRGSPLEVLRSAVRYPTGVLRWAGVRPVVRDEFSVREFPHDDYELTPASFADVDEALHEPGLRWGAAKAHVHLQRRRNEGLR